MVIISKELKTRVYVIDYIHIWDYVKYWCHFVSL